MILFTKVFVFKCLICRTVILVDMFQCDPQSVEGTDNLSVQSGPVMAVLAVIGGVDSRPRLGGVVEHKEWGLGTVSRIAPNGKVTLQCEGQKGPKISPISQLKPVSEVLV